VNFLSHPHHLNDLWQRSIYRPMLEASQRRRDTRPIAGPSAGGEYGRTACTLRLDFSHFEQDGSWNCGLRIERCEELGEKVVSYSDAPFESEVIVLGPGIWQADGRPKKDILGVIGDGAAP
jgi:hypothetical protein